MARPIEHSISNFTSRSPNYSLFITGGFVVCFLIGGLALVLFARNWGLAVIFALSILAIFVFAYFGYAQARKFIASNRRQIDLTPAQPEIQKQSLNIEVNELARVLKVRGEQMDDLLSAYIVAEDLALRAIQQEENQAPLRHVTVGKTPFDAVLITDDLITCIEIMFLATPDIRREKVDAMLRKIGSVKRLATPQKADFDIRLLLLLVTQLDSDGEKQLRSTLNTKTFTNTPVDIDIRLLDFEALQKTYITD